MPRREVQKLRGQFPIVDPKTGKPTDYFLRLLYDSNIFSEEVDNTANDANDTANNAQSEVENLESVIQNLSIDSLTDVDTTTTPPMNSQALVYDDASSTWMPGNVSSGGTSAIDDLTDVDTTTTPPTDGQALVWNNVDMEWAPGDVSTGSFFDIADLSASDEIYLYFGFDTDWRIRRVLRTDGSSSEATNVNNGSFATLNDAWPNRATLTYA